MYTSSTPSPVQPPEPPYARRREPLSERSEAEQSSPEVKPVVNPTDNQISSPSIKPPS